MSLVSRDRLRQWFRRNAARVYYAERAIRGFPVVLLRYPVDVRPRYGFGSPPHSELYRIIDAQRNTYERFLHEFRPYANDLLKIPDVTEDSGVAWQMPMLPALDCAMLYSFLRYLEPAHYVEVGSGYSTKVAVRAIGDGHLRTRVTSIDPQPRADVDEICHTVIRQRLEENDLRWIHDVEPGDVLFIDNSHCCYQNSDVTVFFLEVLPRLKPGVIVHLHDITLPYDYPPEWRERFYSEQYLLACWLLANEERFEILMPNNFLSCDPPLLSEMDWLWKEKAMQQVVPDGKSFWFRIR